MSLFIFRLIEAKDVVYECGPNCGCGLGCVNPTSQRGIKYRLEVQRMDLVTILLIFLFKNMIQLNIKLFK